MKTVEIKSEKFGRGNLWILVTKSVTNLELQCVDYLINYYLCVVDTDGNTSLSELLVYGNICQNSHSISQDKWLPF